MDKILRIRINANEVLQCNYRRVEDFVEYKGPNPESNDEYWIGTKEKLSETEKEQIISQIELTGLHFTAYNNRIIN